MPGTVRIGHHDLQVRNIEREVVVSTIPQDNVHFLLGLTQDLLVIHTGIYNDAIVDVRFVFLAFLDRALVFI